MRVPLLGSVICGFAFSLAATPIAHAIVELNAVVRPSLAASQRAWMNCALSAAEQLLAGSARMLSSADIADSAIASCRKGEAFVEDAMFNGGRYLDGYSTVEQMRAKLEKALVQHLDLSRGAVPAAKPSARR